MLLNTEKIVCYWGTWAAYRPGNGQFTFEHIDPTICTHIVYSFFGATADGSVKFLDDWLDNHKDGGYMKHFIELKSMNPNVKLLASIGGWNAESNLFSGIAANPATRTKFSQNVAKFCNDHGFDGFDLDWEYPCQRDSHQAADKENFTLLLKELRRALGSKILSIATASAQFSAEKSYNIADVASTVDFVNLMTYDLHGVWDGKTGINAPLYAGSDQNKQVNVDACVNFWLSKGCPSEKIILGIPTYGRSFTLANTSNNGINEAITGGGTAGPFTREVGMLGYNEICVNKWPVKWESQQKVPYAVKGDQWVGYDNVQSIEIKCDYINKKNLGGAMFWSLETDDFLGRGGEGKYPLIKAAHNILRSNDSSKVKNKVQFMDELSKSCSMLHARAVKMPRKVLELSFCCCRYSKVEEDVELPTECQCIKLNNYRDH